MHAPIGPPGKKPCLIPLSKPPCVPAPPTTANCAAAPRTVDSNGAPLADGDSVTLIKDLDVKGTSFVAKRGTLVKGVRLTDNPEHVEGRVNKVSIVLKTCFLKKA